MHRESVWDVGCGGWIREKPFRVGDLVKIWPRVNIEAGLAALGLAVEMEVKVISERDQFRTVQARDGRTWEISWLNLSGGHEEEVAPGIWEPVHLRYERQRR